jgi:hypothetical protein
MPETPRPRIQVVSQRRSQRLAISISVRVFGNKATSELFKEDTTTLVVNAHGGLLALKERVVIGQPLRLRTMSSEEEIDCIVVDVETGEDGGPEIGVEFVTPNEKFWHISFPPADWSARSPEAKRFTRTISAAPANPEPAKK